MFQRLLLAAAVALSTATLPTVLIATPAMALQCPADAPDGHKRPGGYCELRDSTATLAPSLTAPPAAEVTPVVAPGGGGCAALDVRRLLMHRARGSRVLTAC